LKLREDQSINRINRIQYYNQNILNKDQKVLRFSINYQKLAHYKKKLSILSINRDPGIKIKSTQESNENKNKNKKYNNIFIIKSEIY